MERNKALEIIKEQLPEKRFIHTVGVLQTALELAEKYGCDMKKTELAAIFHDYAKYRSTEEMRNVIIEEKLPKRLLDFPKELWHAPVGAVLVKKEAGINDLDVLNAITHHTTGRPNMTLLEKVIFLADYIEPGRSFPGVDDVRSLAQKSLDQAVLRSLQNTITHLISTQSLVYPDTIDTYNDYIRKGIGSDQTNN